MKLPLSILLTLLSLNLQAQFVVQDPTSHQLQLKQIANTASTLANSREQIQHAQKGVEEAKKTANFLKNAKEALDKVNNYFRSIEVVTRTIAYQKQTLERAESAINYCKSSNQFTPYEINLIIYNFTTIIAATSRSLALLNQIMEDGFFKMNDAERLQALTNLNREVAASRHDVTRLYDHYAVVIGKRQMFKAFER